MKPGTILIDSAFASLYGVEAATKLTVTRTVDDERVEVEWDEFGEHMTDVVNVDEYTVLPDLPADATGVTPWESNAGIEQIDNHGPFRLFTGSSWVVPATDALDPTWAISSDQLTVRVEGIQRADGSVSRWVNVVGWGGEGGPDNLPSTAARLLAESLAAAAAEIERLR